uniref:Uncharacterized protein n=1 Tax=Candidatus Kentrum eta TaxID=2126337 RepID=A0A450U6H6_9GAMM|nr:MAG: hypothetical protein BECKH772A_GA0070896_1000239 [Candidatus Kentron sp. H]VFJ88800.1 MAG: hypothetical protein BECKH772B_GA0070898_1000235 [Candidatus Kentron sp. H]VFJ95053.1 MAG: hypothetical protein BECKH772C_GA0070978_1000186 [Candidatus Kentron sp. H]
MNDPIFDEVRRIRDEHSKRFGYDLGAICADYKAHQVQAGSRLIRLRPKIAANKSPHRTAAPPALRGDR